MEDRTAPWRAVVRDLRVLVVRAADAVADEAADDRESRVLDDRLDGMRDVGEVVAGLRLLDVCQDALAAGIAEARVANHLTDISHAIQVVVEDAGFSVVRSLVGHGVGRSYHEDPQIPNYGAPGRGPVLQEGMTLAIEPMITAGRPEVYVHDDDWSISSADNSLAAHFEHTVAVTSEGPRILTTAKAPLLR